MSKDKEPEQQFSEPETARRRDDWLRRSLNTPPKTHAEVVAERKAKAKRGEAGRNRDKMKQKR